MKNVIKIEDGFTLYTEGDLNERENMIKCKYCERQFKRFSGMSISVKNNSFDLCMKCSKDLQLSNCIKDWILNYWIAFSNKNKKNE